MEGTMLWFNSEKRHGFIQTDEGERLRVDQEGLAAGQLLQVEEARAVNVAIVPPIAARRARSRGHR